MARSETVTVMPGAWVELTNADVSAITFQNVSAGPLYIKGTVAGAPTDDEGALRYESLQGERKVRIDDLFPGALRLWAKAKTIITEVSVQHA